MHENICYQMILASIISDPSVSYYMSLNILQTQFMLSTSQYNISLPNIIL